MKEKDIPRRRQPFMVIQSNDLSASSRFHDRLIPRNNISTAHDSTAIHRDGRSLLSGTTSGISKHKLLFVLLIAILTIVITCLETTYIALFSNMRIKEKGKISSTKWKRSETVTLEPYGKTSGVLKASVTKPLVVHHHKIFAATNSVQKKWNITCKKCSPGCGCYEYPGFQCDPSFNFTGNFICHDSIISGCGLGHQLNAIAVSWAKYGDQFRLVDQIIGGDHPEYLGLSWSAFINTGDLLIPRDGTMFTKCSRTTSGYDNGVNPENQLRMKGYTQNILLPFFESHPIHCPTMPPVPSQGVAVKIRSGDHRNPQKDAEVINKYCVALETKFNVTNHTPILVMTDGPELNCTVRYNITYIEELETPNMYNNSAQRLLCNLRYIAHYPGQISATSSNLQQFIWAEMLKIGNTVEVYNPNFKVFVKPPIRES